jgi:transcriptional regulator with XRE-family HTH domain
MSRKFVSFVMIFFQKNTDFYRYMANRGKAIVDRIDKRAAEIGTSRPKLADKAKIARNTFANWASRDTIPPADIALAISDELQCSVRWLVTGAKDKQEEYSVEEKNLISKFRLLDKQGQFELKALLEAKTVPVGKETIPEILTAAEKKRTTG